ncbi:Holliday junction DNA helicase subunit RuvA [Actinokineospora alba]|uniref:Holliday junction branch migration complex subunit RuvA n=1 Tax=Actinokineospora alba TaxID=504798 RepID=A0A1H0TNV1_9PSEU|nr:Holliday junction branch migration protein RuvA [Actinokineospora alba]TDP70618.1 Holliday junction DNA helicase subunit RuvA [Actinokineospora alba]SDJ11768.1 holliday junction DNA helicase RuvA [Actinokineospora alba]SDP55445.1 Holliday junction DNA helicase subunit RuvA [Actinokineospora alba]
MISSVRGTVAAIGLDHVVVEVGGVGLAVQATPHTLATLRRGEETSLATALVVREDSLTLFGFADTEARDLFRLLQTVSGIGPRLALATLAVLEPDQLRAALADGNITILTQVPGIGRKGAERLIIELRDKVGTVAGESPAAPAGQVRGSVVEALVGLGFAAKQAEAAVDGVLAENGVSDTSAVLRKALATLGRKR